VIGRVVHVESEVAGTRFLPLGRAPADDGRTLSAQRAYNAMLESPSSSALIPAGVSAYYGVLSRRSSSPTVTHLRVLGFAVESGCVDRRSSSASDGPASPPTACRKWEFVNARTGHDLGVITQEVLAKSGG